MYFITYNSYRLTTFIELSSNISLPYEVHSTYIYSKMFICRRYFLVIGYTTYAHLAYVV